MDSFRILFKFRAKVGAKGVIRQDIFDDIV
jgi:hypothetical protein